MYRVVFLLVVYVFSLSAINKVKAGENRAKFKVIAFYTSREDQAHISFVHEANAWFSDMAKKHRFIYDSTNDWTRMNTAFLAQYDIVVFLDTRPDDSLQRMTFEQYISNGGAWMGFHFAGFALTPSDFPQNWTWYHEQFLGSGEYLSNTWRPTSAMLKVEDKNHPATKNLPAVFKSSPANGTGGRMTSQKILPYIFCYPSIHPVFRWAPVRSRMKYGMKGITL